MSKDGSLHNNDDEFIVIVKLIKCSRFQIQPLNPAYV